MSDPQGEVQPITDEQREAVRKLMFALLRIHNPAIDEEAHEQRVQRRQGRRFGHREHAETDPADDDHRHHERPRCAACRTRLRLPVNRFAARILAIPRDDAAHHEKAERR